jgi:phosphoglycolate phosphatase-like HAD superfamily hydrolase
MKKTYLIVLVSIFCNAIPTTQSTIKKPIIITDYDDVWNMKMFFLNLFTSFEPSENKDHRLGNLTLKILDNGRRYPFFASYTPWLIEYIGKARHINQPIHDLYKHLKAENYSIVMATNKDHLLYDLSIEELGNEIPSMVDTVFVAEPKSDANAIAQLQAFADQPTTPKNYKELTYRALNLKETKKIVHVPSKKPAKEYYIYVTQRIGNDNDMIFIDDNKDNVDAFNALQEDTTHLRLGIRYDENDLNQFTEDLKKAGLVSENGNHELLNEIRYPGITGKIKSTFASLFGQKNTQTKTAE